MPDRRYAAQEDQTGSWAVIDHRTGLAAFVRGRQLASLTGPAAHDAAAFLNMIDEWRHEPPADLPPALSGRRPFATGSSLF